MEYVKRDSSNPSEIHALEYVLLEDKMKSIAVRNNGVAEENFYTKRRHEIEMKWLEDKTLDADRNYVWHANMPIPFWLCKQVYDASKKMPKGSVIALVFPDYELDAAEIALFDVLFDYGRARGLEIVAGKLYEGAENGDPRAVKMYLELMELIGVDLDDEDSRIKKLMRVSLDI